MKSSLIAFVLALPVFFFLFLNPAYAQPKIANGCEYYWNTKLSGQVYQTYIGTYNKKPAYNYGEPDAILDSSLSSCYKWVRTGNSGSCYVKDNYYYGAGYAGYFQAVTNCPIDDYVFYMLIVFLVFGYFLISKRIVAL